MIKKKSAGLGELAIVLLRIVADATERDASGAIRKFFVPPPTAIYGYEPAGTWIGGPGCAAAFRSLERRGYIERPDTTLPNKYCYVVTEAGVAAIARAMLRQGLTPTPDGRLESELVLPLPNGGTLRCGRGELHVWGGYIRLCDENGDEIVMWEREEFSSPEESESILGAIMSAATMRTIPRVLKLLNKTRVVDGCWV